MPRWSKDHFETKFSEFEIVVATYFYSKLHLKCNMFHKQTVSECYAKVCHVTVLKKEKHLSSDLTIFCSTRPFL